MQKSKVKSRSYSKESSFTLLELLIVIAIIAILAAVVLIALNDAKQSAWEARGLQFSQNIKSTLGADLVGEWSFDTTDFIDPTHIRDTSGNNNNGTIYGAMPESNGKVREALRFDGLDDYVDILNSPSLESLTRNLTIAFWAYPTNIAKGRQNPLGKSYGGEFDLTMEPTGQLNYYHGTAGGNSWPYMNCGARNIFTNNQWVFVVITRDINNQSIQCYKNGELQSFYCGVWQNPSSSSRRLGIGFEYAGYFQGIIDEVKLYDNSLSAKQIQQLYAESLSRHIADKK